MSNARVSGQIRHGTSDFRRVNVAMFAVGFTTFGLLYCVQPLMPEFVHRFGVSAVQSALSLSLTSAVLAVAMLFAGPVADACGRKPVMSVGLIASCALALASAAVPSWTVFLALRAVMGLTLAGLPAVAMTYLNEELHADSLGLGMGLYIGGNAAGGLLGRLLAGVLDDFFGWRIAVAVIAVLGLMAALAFVRCLPVSRNFTPRNTRPRAALRVFGGLFRDPGLRWLFVTGFMLLGSFVTIYNYIGFHLMAAPFELGQATVGTIFGVYVVGIFSSSWVGHLAGRVGRRRVLWTMFVLMLLGLALMLLDSVPAIILGLAVITFGFFGGHSIASSWVGRRAGAAKIQASSMYLFAYYLGSSVVGALGGVFYGDHGWPGVAAFTAGVCCAGLLIAWRLYYLPPLAKPQSPATEAPLP